MRSEYAIGRSQLRRPQLTLVFLALAACSGGKADDTQVASGSGSGSAGSGSAGSGSAIDAAPAIDGPPAKGPGDLSVKVEWKDVPVPARASPGRTSCNTPRAPSVNPTTTWQIPEAFVVVDGAPPPPDEVRVVLAACAFAPRAVVGKRLVLESAVDHPTRVTLAKWGDLEGLDKLAAGAERTIQLPIAGHAVALTLEPDAIYRLATDDKEPETAWIVAGPAAVTDASGQATVHVEAGEHAIRALVPARGGQPAHVGSGKATVVAGDLVEVTVALAP